MTQDQLELRPLPDRCGIDLTGQVFFRLTVMQYAGWRNRHYYWLCRCECGEQVCVTSARLRRDKPSCGCYRREAIYKANNFHAAGVIPNAKTKITVCSIKECGQPHASRGMCEKHYSRWRKRGTIDLPDRVAMFWDNVHRSDKGTECWEWQGNVTLNGYGEITINGIVGAHRIAYSLIKGDIPDGMFVCHTCDNRRCANPEHLFLGTHRDNMRDMWSKGRARPGRVFHPTYCKRNNHERTPENTRVLPNGKYTCILCSRESKRRRVERKFLAQQLEVSAV